MARIIYSGLVTGIHGSVGGSTFQSNAFGFTVRNKPNITRLNSLSQNERKRKLDYVTKGWGTLTQIQRDQWTAFAIAHPQRSIHNPDAILNGFQFFVKWNLVETMFVSTFRASPSEGSFSLPTLNPYLAIAGSVLNFNPNPSFTTYSLFANLYLSPPVKGYATYAKNKTRAIAFMDFGGGNTDITAAYTEKFGVIPAVNSFIFCELQLWSAIPTLLYPSQYFTIQVS